MKVDFGSLEARASGRVLAESAAAPVLIASLIVGMAARLWLSLHDDGIFWADEVFQSLEPAHRLVFGYGKVAWEFEKGARSWAYPGAIAAVFKLASWFGAGPIAYLTLLRVLLCALAPATAAGVYYLARCLKASALSAAVAAAVFMLAEPMIYFAHRAMSETASALPVVWGFAWLLARRPERRRPLLGAALLALACLIRLQNGIFCVAILGVYALRRDTRDLLRVLAVFTLGAFAYGLLDALTWGGWFHSAIEYFRFNVIDGEAAHWGTSPFYFYARALFTSMFALALPMCLLALPAARREPALALSILAFLLVHSAVGHKEYRFILPVIPLLCALAGLGLDAASALSARAAPALLRRTSLLPFGLLLLAVVSCARLPSLRMGQLGRTDGREDSAYDRFGPVNRLLLAAHARQDLCGVSVPEVPWWNLGGYTYLHRRVPLYAEDEAKANAFNYVIAPERSVAGEVIASDSGQALVRVAARCVPDSGWKF